MTEQQHYQRMEALFHELVDLPGATRDERIAELARTDPALADALSVMFSRTNSAGEGILEELAAQAQILTQAPPMPETIGPYRIIRLLGEGGMGRVYEAEQLVPVQRRVALKLTHSVLDRHRDIARFHAERQALAVFDHPNIARIFDVGTHSDGRPWFAMELIHGVSITQWASQRQLALPARLELLLPVCDAVQHAHRKGVIHRDLKPSNILVCEEDGKPIPKIIDFGIAKPLHPVHGERDATKAGELIGTPEYMSPEQASLGAIDVDTRSDVYALGLVLFELLVGQLPMTLGDLRRLAFDEMCRRIREDEPPRPSAMLGRNVLSGSALTSAEWVRRIRGDLDAVVLKALAKDREQRYESAAGLASDLRRFLADQPVHAAPPTWRYRLRKWIKRNRTASVAAGIVLVSIAIAGTWSVRSYFAVERAAEIAEGARQEAEAVTGFLLQLFKAADPRAEPGANPSARDLLARGLQQLDAADAGISPDARLRLMEGLGDAAYALGDYEQSQAMFSRALALHATRQPALADRQAFLQDRLGAIARDRGDLTAAARWHRTALDTLSQAGMAKSQAAARTHNNLAIIQRRQRDLAGAKASYETAINLIPANEPGSDQLHAGALLNLAAVLHDLGDSAAAIQMQKRALGEFQLILPSDHPDFAVIYSNMSMVHRSVGLLHEALDYALKARANEIRNLPENHPDRAESLHNEAAVLIRLDRLDEARQRLQDAKSLLTRALTGKTPRLAVHIDSLAEIDLLQGNYPAAIQALTGLIEALPDQPGTLRQRLVSLRKLGMAQRGAKQWQRAIATADRARALAEASQRPADIALAYLLKAMIALDQDQHELAGAHYRAALTALPECEHASCALDQGSTNLLRAHYLARTANAGAALTALQYALDHPLWSASILSHEDLDSIRQHPGWPALEKRLAQRLDGNANRDSTGTPSAAPRRRQWVEGLSDPSVLR